jgi:hypothetical protein
MSKAAFRGTNKVMKACPFCGAGGPKEFVEGPKRVNWVMFAILFLFTAGVGLLAVPLWYRSYLEAYCEKCSQTFAP